MLGASDVQSTGQIRGARAGGVGPEVALEAEASGERGLEPS
jgi:hypothetical protein